MERVLININIININIIYIYIYIYIYVYIIVIIGLMKKIKYKVHMDFIIKYEKKTRSHI